MDHGGDSVRDTALAKSVTYIVGVVLGVLTIVKIGMYAWIVSMKAYKNRKAILDNQSKVLHPKPENNLTQTVCRMEEKIDATLGALQTLSTQVGQVNFWYTSMNDMDKRPMFITDKAGNLVKANIAFLKFTQRTMSEVAGNQWLTVVHPDDRERVTHEWNSSIRAKRNFEYSFRYLVDGRSIQVLCHAIFNPAHGHMGFVSREWDSTKEA